MIFTNKQLNINDAEKFKEGDVYFEAVSYGGCWHCVVTSPAVVTEVDGRKKVSWKAKTVRVHSDFKTDSKEQEIDFSLTEGYAHYGPQIHDDLIRRESDLVFVSFKDSLKQ